jgi:hypothetical protein
MQSTQAKIDPTTDIESIYEGFKSAHAKGTVTTDELARVIDALEDKRDPSAVAHVRALTRLWREITRTFRCRTCKRWLDADDRCDECRDLSACARSGPWTTWPVNPASEEQTLAYAAAEANAAIRRRRSLG